ncbi:alpha/beta hydrolase [Xanthomonas euvesicatoria pv. alangii]|uniref:alpha/beta fold hydrolase n=1 Tax=Xanthomonas euvesicatoria TaxID=456327 RepID=UPI001C4532A4|nr:alpha/beta hydrolase [Xanthomonas euvesicatoria]MBV6670065.1 alpha/beta hydrolase [Xanthomonas euvesicatoria pv. alangii]
MNTIEIVDQWVTTESGKLFTRRWVPTVRHPGAVPVVLFHDSLGCVELWRDFPSRLASTTGREVIAYDRLGFGRSDSHPGALSPLDFVHEEATTGFSAVRNALGLDHFIALGHSVGGGMAIECAAAYPAHCQALVTESAQAFAEERTLQGIRQAKQSFAQPGQLQRLEKYHGEKATWVLHAWVDVWLAPEFATWRLDEALRAVKCPVLAIHGANDEYGSTRHPQRIIELATGPSELLLLKDCGHVPHREQEERVISHIAAWPRLTGLLSPPQ